MSTEDNKALIRSALEEEWNQGNFAHVDELNTSDFVYHTDSMTFQGREPFKQYLSMLITAFPDLHVSIEDVIGEGDRVVVRCTLHGTHQGEMMGMAPTGKQVAVTGIAIILIANGKLVEEWANTDTLGMMQQLGVIPAPG